MKTTLRIVYQGTEFTSISSGTDNQSYKIEQFMKDNDLTVEEIRIERTIDNLFLMKAFICAKTENAPLGNIDFTCEMISDDDIENCAMLERFMLDLASEDI